MWDKLLETALLGSDKRPVILEDFTDHVQSALKELTADDPESQLLQATTLISYHRQAGLLPVQYPAVEYQTIDETREEAPSEVLQLLDELERTDHTLKTVIMSNWLALLSKKQWIVSPNQVLRLLHLVNGMSNAIKQETTDVIGDRGKWILSFDSQYKITIDQPIDLWNEGNTNQRKVYLSEAIVEDAEQALSMLKSTWGTESVTIKKAFLTVIDQNLKPCFSPFINQCYEGEFSWKKSERKTERECRQICTSILLKVSTSELYTKTIEALTSYFGANTKRSLISSLISSKTLTFRLPSEPDGFFNKDRMLEEYGFEDQYDIALFDDENQYWLSKFLTHVPASWWVAQFPKGYEGMVDYFLESQEHKSKIGRGDFQTYLNPLIQNTWSFEDSTLAKKLIKRYDVANKDQLLSICPILDMSDFEAFVLSNHLMMEPEALDKSPKGTWSPSFSKEVIKHAYESIKINQYWILIHIAKAAIEHLDIETDAYLEKTHLKAKTESLFKIWDKNFYNPMKTTIYIKKLTDSYQS